MRERPVSHVPRRVKVLLVLALAGQLTLQSMRPAGSPEARALSEPPAASLLSVAALGEPVALARVLLLTLLAHDKQPGVTMLYRELDYERVESWLARTLELDPLGQAPLFAASRLYAEVAKGERQRRMLEFVHAEFLRDPARRWPWLAYSVVVAKHKLGDIALARRYAHALRSHTSGHDVPDWARQMEVFILADMDELESARVLLGAMLESGQVADANEARFLLARLDELEQSAKEK